jgi:putative ABC transport system permease protein
MNTFRQLVHRAISFCGRSRDARELDVEISHHLDQAIEENLRAGMTPQEARRQALIHFGGTQQAKESAHEQRSLPWLETLAQDLRYGSRMLRKYPAFTAVAVLTLALGIGANTAIFSLIDGILLRPLRFSNPQELVSVTANVAATYPKGAFAAMREQISSMDVATYYEGHEFNLTGQGEAVRLNGAVVSAEFFMVLGVRPDLGRAFYPGEDKVGQDSYVILSRGLWQQRFASDPAIIGRSIELEGVSRQVVGVMPADFRFPSSKTQVWIPLHIDPKETVAMWGNDFMPVIGRLHRGATIAQASAEVRLFQSRVTKLFPWPMPASWNPNVHVVELQNGLVADVRGRLLLLLSAVGLILLIVCVNVANLTLSRAATREKEMALRAAMGAARPRVVRQLLTESILLALVGGLLGFLIATQGLHLLKSVLPADTPRLSDVHIDWRVLVFTSALAIVTGVLFGLAPALQSSRVALSGTLNASGRGGSSPVSHRLRSALAIAEVALAVLLVTAAGLLIRSFWALSHVDPGFCVSHLMTARVTPNEGFCSDPQRCIAFYEELLARLRAVQGITSVALVNTLPLDGRVAKRSLAIEGETVPPGEPLPLLWMDVITPDYLQLMNIPVMAGRGLNPADVTGNAPVVVVTAATAKRYWPDRSAIGSHVRFSEEQQWRTVIGIVPDVRAYDMQNDVPGWINGTMYIPYAPNATLEDGRVPSDMTIVLQANGNESQIQDTLRQTVAMLNPEAPVSEIKPMRAVLSESVSAPASTTFLFVAFALLALVLGAIGIYGVLSFLVSTRTREIGIRISLGALPRDVLWLILKEGAQFSLVGIALGLASAFVLTRLLASELYGVSPADPLTFAAAAFLMLLVTALACYVPTRRAMRVDPMITLRSE